MICENCGEKITWDLSRCKLSDDILKYMKVPDCYKGYTWAKICGKCNSFIDYKDLPVDEFISWLNDCDEGKDSSSNLKGKALIRYFDLDKLLQLKKDAGD